MHTTNTESAARKIAEAQKDINTCVIKSGDTYIVAAPRSIKPEEELIAVYSRGIPALVLANLSKGETFKFSHPGSPFKDNYLKGAKGKSGFYCKNLRTGLSSNHPHASVVSRVRLFNKQTVPFAPGDTETQIEQTARYHAGDDWVTVTHGIDVFSMSRENWVKLCQMAAQEIFTVANNGIAVKEAGLPPIIVLDSIEPTKEAIAALRKELFDINPKPIIEAYRDGAHKRRAIFVATSNDGVNWEESKTVVDSNPDAKPWVGNYFDRPEKIIPERDTFDPNA